MKWIPIVLTIIAVVSLCWVLYLFTQNNAIDQKDFKTIDNNKMVNKDIHTESESSRSKVKLLNEKNKMVIGNDEKDNNMQKKIEANINVSDRKKLGKIDPEQFMEWLCELWSKFIKAKDNKTKRKILCEYNDIMKTGSYGRVLLVHEKDRRRELQIQLKTYVNRFGDAELEIETKYHMGLSEDQTEDERRWRLRLNTIVDLLDNIQRKDSHGQDSLNRIIDIIDMLSESDKRFLSKLRCERENLKLIKKRYNARKFAISYFEE